MCKHVVTATEEGIVDQAHASTRGLFLQHNSSILHSTERLPEAFLIYMNTSHGQLMRETGAAPEKQWFIGAEHHQTSSRGKAASLIICPHFYLPLCLLTA